MRIAILPELRVPWAPGELASAYCVRALFSTGRPASAAVIRWYGVYLFPEDPAMPFIDTSTLKVIERLPGPRGGTCYRGNSLAVRPNPISDLLFIMPLIVVFYCIAASTSSSWTVAKRVA